jgi:hypothetical protein
VRARAIRIKTPEGCPEQWFGQFSLTHNRIKWTSVRDDTGLARFPAAWMAEIAAMHEARRRSQ